MQLPPNHRRAVISGLRELADFLACNRDIPVPLVVEVDYHPRGETDEEKRAVIDHIAKILGTTPEKAAAGEHYMVRRRFGAVQYKAVTVSRRDMERWEALLSYSENVLPDNEPPGAEE